MPTQKLDDHQSVKKQSCIKTRGGGQLNHVDTNKQYMLVYVGGIYNHEAKKMEFGIKVSIYEPLHKKTNKMLGRQPRS